MVTGAQGSHGHMLQVGLELDGVCFFMWEGEELEWGHWRPFFFWRWMECVGPAVDTVSLFRIIGCLC